MRIAIFQIDYPLQSYTRDLANGLTLQGFDVDLYITNFRCDEFIDPKSIKCTIITLSFLGAIGLFSRMARIQMAKYFGLSLAVNPWSLKLLALTHLKMKAPYDVFIGIEKAGLELATFCAKGRVPVIYYSLELYIEHHPRYKDFSWARRSEILCHKKASGTIIQDAYRWGSLRLANNIANDNPFYLPVGIEEDGSQITISNNNDPPPHGKCVIIYFGVISKDRYFHEMIEQAKKLPSDIHLHIHGPIYDESLKKYIESVPTSNVIITSEMLSETDMHAVISSASVGLALYRTDNDNDRLTAYASQKIALYLKAGLPIIVFQSESYCDLFRRVPCGVMIDSLEEFSDALNIVLDNYMYYVNNARRAYHEIYKLGLYWSSLGDYLVGISKKNI